MDVTAKSATILLRERVTSVYGAPFFWLPDNKTLLCKLLPADMGPVPAESPVPKGAVIRQTSGRKAPARQLLTDRSVGNNTEYRPVTRLFMAGSL